MSGTASRLLSPVTVGVLLTAAGSVGFGLLPLVLGILYDDGVDPESALVFRYVGAVVGLGLWFLVRRTGCRGVLPSLFAGVAIGGATVFLFRGYAALPASLTVLVFYTYPAFTLLIGRVAFGVRLEPRTTLAIAMVLGASGLILSPGNVAPSLLPMIAVTFCAPIGYAIYLSLLARLPVETAMAVRLLGINAGACFVILPILAFGGAGMVLPSTAAGWLAALYLPVVTGLVATGLIALGASLAGGARAAVAGASELVTALAIGWLLFGEEAGWHMMAGAALILAAIAVSVPRPRRGRRGSPPEPAGTSPR